MGEELKELIFWGKELGRINLGTFCWDPLVRLENFLMDPKGGKGISNSWLMDGNGGEDGDRF